MKITKLRTDVVHLPFGLAIKQEGLGELRSVDCVLVFLETDAGLIGEGLAYSINKQRVASLHEMVRSFESLVVGLDPEFGGSFVSRAWSAIGAFGHAGMTVAGMAGIDEAILDLRAKAAGMNVSRLLGAGRKAVPVYRSVGLGYDYSLDQLQRAAAEFVKSGFRGMKMNVGKHSLEEDVRRVNAVRDVIGPDISLMVDLNQRLTAPQAIRLGRALEPFRLAWLEEPVRYYDHAAEAVIAAALDMPIASGESEYTFRGILQMLQQRCADIVMPDLQHMGGPTGFLKAMHLAEAFDTPVSSHLFHEMSLALLAAGPNSALLEYAPWFEPLYRERLELDREGRAVVPLVPGWGFSFDPTAVERYRAE
jgi:L-alanine-DL-glutamate epimerase-like enolase superfamily enzyme